jgi:hypothetical protein
VKHCYDVHINRMRWDGRVGRMRGITSVYKFLVDKCEGKTYLEVVRWEGVEWINLA